jgi:crotonobetainyl-CoA:carnitine CoA-transferase CaiB-like acyl-CoA transferase
LFLFFIWAGALMLPLQGLLVVTIEQAVAAPLCSSKLAAAGARVIKVEREEGDFARNYDTAARGESSYFTWLNQGKESVCLDFKTEKDAAVLRNMLAKADVLVQNLSPGALARAGFSAETLHKLNPRLVICNISGYGFDGKAATRRGYDLLVQAESGLISVSGSPGAQGRIGVSVCDIGAGVTAYSGVLEALLKRHATGVGEELSVSLFGVAADWMAVPYMHAEYGEGAPEPVGLKHPSIAPYGAYRCADGKQTLLSIQNEREWQRLCTQALKAPGLLEDSRFVSNNSRVENVEALEACINTITGGMSSETFQQRLGEAKIAYGAINSASDINSHVAFESADYRTTTDQLVELPAPPVRWLGSDARRPSLGRTPVLGEHTEKVRAEFE